MTLTLSSSAFDNGQPIPPRFAQAGDNLSPALAWTGAPEKTASYVLVVEDHDAPVGTFTHWVAYDIPVAVDGLDEGLAQSAFPQARNDVGQARYDGPKPPKGHGAHRYHFRLAALDTASLDLPPDADATAVANAARGHVLAEADLIGTFETV